MKTINGYCAFSEEEKELILKHGYKNVSQFTKEVVQEKILLLKEQKYHCYTNKNELFLVELLTNRHFRIGIYPSKYNNTEFCAYLSENKNDGNNYIKVSTSIQKDVYWNKTQNNNYQQLIDQNKLVEAFFFFLKEKKIILKLK